MVRNGQNDKNIVFIIWFWWEFNENILIEFTHNGAVFSSFNYDKA